MKLDTPNLDKFLAITKFGGAETYFTVQLPSGERATIDVNDLFREIHRSLHSLHHFMDPDGAHHTGYPTLQKQVKPEDNPTGRAAIGHET